ncbi:flagellin [Rhizobium sp. AN73]|uniref:flagellin n=1 Tax=Rhizobium sp. AN73 TaxID=3035124 RepID=UPI0024792AA4|nr:MULTISPECIES: flagellin [unclassified Rhizobium]
MWLFVGQPRTASLAVWGREGADDGRQRHGHPAPERRFRQLPNHLSRGVQSRADAVRRQRRHRRAGIVYPRVDLLVQHPRLQSRNREPGSLSGQPHLYSPVDRKPCVRFGSDRRGLYSNLVANIDGKIQQLTSKMAYVGSVQSALDLYDENNKKRIDVATRGIGRLVDADMDATCLKLRALETQQQLAINGLHVANSQPSTLLQLFQQQFSTHKKSEGMY